ncbi:phosphate acetyltransferase [Advenella sp. RU8]|uniref:phosphate acetyltransferase n=1 Tax=Advenella sp. RU8 TaxID=3399575 RepID=UPI003AAE85FC
MNRNDRFQELVNTAANLEKKHVCVVVHPCDEVSLSSAVQAGRLNLFIPVLVGPEERIRQVALENSLDISGLQIINTEHSHASADAAVAEVQAGRATLMMKGSLHSDELLHSVLCYNGGLRTERRISHVFVMDVPSYDKLLFITDGAINIFPTLCEKADIIRNAIDLHLALGLDTPRVAILSAVEQITEKLQSTIDAAALCKMADRGQIKGGILDGPLAMDNAISPEAAQIKGIQSAVAGHAQILVVPDLEAGNMLVKNLTFLSGADAAGIVLGARVPIILTSRADSERTRLASCAVAVVYADSLLKKKAIGK